MRETVTVTGDPPVVQTTSAEVTTAVAERNYFPLLRLDSNVVARAPGSNGLCVCGHDVWNFGTYVDGTSNFSKWMTLQRASAGFSLETVSEMQIDTNQFSAEFGGHSAGVMKMIMKSGSNCLRRGGAGRPAGRPRRGSATRHTEGAVRSTRVRRQSRRADRSR